MLFVQTAEVNFKSVPPENKHLFADSIDTPLSNNPNIHISLIYDNLTEMEKGFIQLAKGGKITMPLEKQFWKATFGMLTDKYGLHWIMNFDHSE